MLRFVLPLRWPWRTPPEPPAPDAFAGKLIILASEGRPIAQAAVELAGRMAERAGAEVHARIWGTSLGLPHPGLVPNRRELKEQHDCVAGAVAWLKHRDIAVSGQVASTRSGSQCGACGRPRDPRRAGLLLGRAAPLRALHP